MKKSDDAIPEFLRTARWRVAIYLFLVAVLIGLIGYLVSNTISLTKVLDEDAKVYAADIMRRSERDVAARIISLQDRARGLASGFRTVPDDKLDDVLERLDDTSVVFDGMLLVSPDGIVAQSGEIIKGVPEWAMAVEDPFSFMDVGSVTGLDLLISVPVPGAEHPLALVCQQSDSSLNQALEGALFDNLCFSCIVNGQGEIAVMPETPLPEDEFENITSQSTREYFASIIDAVEREAGDTDEEDFVISSVTNTKGSESYMACVPLDFGDWYLMTFVPVRLFTRHADVFIQRYWAPIILTLLLFVALLAVIWRGHVERTSELKNMLYVDPLTGGLTDAAFQKRARGLAKRNSGAPYSVVCFRVLAFHNVNECYGADVSYAMIRAIHDALVGAVAADELVARCERDRFYLLVHAKDLDVLQARVDELIEVMRRAAEEIAPMGSFTVAQGCCSAEEEKENFRLLEDRAARAASHSERLGRCVFYCADLDEKIRREIALDQSYDEALASGEFEVYLQPKVGISQRAGMAAEALVRWNHPQFGMVSPAEFIPLFERNRRICALDTYVFESVCKMVAEWNRGGDLAGLPVSVNLSRICLIDNGLDVIDDLADIKDRYGIPDGQIDLEINETVSLDYELFGLMRDVVERIHERGMTCSLDDFGFGYSSLSLLKDLEFDAIKLDRHFFMGDSDRAWQIIGSFVSLSHDLGMVVVAEGMEERAQVDQLRALDCDLIQGYYYARPLPRNEFERWMREHRYLRE